MAVSRQIAPSAVTALIQDTLEGLDGGAKLFARDFREMSEPLPLYSVNTELLDLRQKGADRSIAASLTQIGWRSLITAPNGEPGLADVKSRNDKLRFSRIVSGERVAAMIGAATACEELADHDDYELRIVESPSLKIAAIWLAGENSVFMPFAGLPQSPISETEFFRALRARVDGGRQSSGLAGLFSVGLVIGAVAAVAAALKGFVGGKGTDRPPVAAVDDGDE